MCLKEDKQLLWRIFQRQIYVTSGAILFFWVLTTRIEKNVILIRIMWSNHNPSSLIIQQRVFACCFLSWPNRHHKRPHEVREWTFTPATKILLSQSIFCNHLWQLKHSIYKTNCKEYNNYMEIDIMKSGRLRFPPVDISSIMVLISTSPCRTRDIIRR